MLYTGLVCCARRKTVLMQKIDLIWLVLIIFKVLLGLVSVRFLTLVCSFYQENNLQIIKERLLMGLLLKTSFGLQISIVLNGRNEICCSEVKEFFEGKN